MRWFVVVTLGCSIGNVDLSNKQCPCVSGYTCDLSRNICVLEGTEDTSVVVEDTAPVDSTRPDTPIDTKLPPGPDCSVHADKKLYCSNKTPANIRATPNNTATIVDTMITNYSWFTCWKAGDAHAGGNTTWYYTLGDKNGKWGYMAASDVETTDAFEKDPSAFGFAKCP
jgi:hypothetical protein